jgi:predicted nucleic acid-binding protein
LSFVARGAVEIAPFDEDLPMDFADATLVVLADLLETTSVFTLDRRDFGTYRLGRRKLTLVPQPRK